MKPTNSFDADATCVIAGGLGGLRRSIVRRMAGRNAKNSILLSQSRAKDKDAHDLNDEMAARGFNIAAPACDIGDQDAVSATISELKQSMPPIKGCIQASMVLKVSYPFKPCSDLRILTCFKDGLFENATSEDFNMAIKPKVQGTWNLHKHLPSQIDFFVLLSSLASVTRIRGQTNYAARNSYKDALARHIVSSGEKCISLNLGPILSIG